MGNKFWFCYGFYYCKFINIKKIAYIEISTMLFFTHKIAFGNIVGDEFAIFKFD